ncbi:MAG: 4Fe-4S dicluster domain-containing protein [Deltaproteobacteria bacterium]|nr:4Fe-4S dicluster domain-containing protein [Deltaproteobacteria bacterium]
MSFSITSLCNGCGACAKMCPMKAISGEKKEQHVIRASLCIECGACGRICPESAVMDDKGKTVARMKKSEWPRPVINVQLCVACENCVAACPTHALAMVNEQLPLAENHAVLAELARCVSCGWCKDNCLFDAITMGGAA